MVCVCLFSLNLPQEVVLYSSLELKILRLEISCGWNVIIIIFIIIIIIIIIITIIIIIIISPFCSIF